MTNSSILSNPMIKALVQLTEEDQESVIRSLEMEISMKKAGWSEKQKELTRVALECYNVDKERTLEIFNEVMKDEKQRIKRQENGKEIEEHPTTKRAKLEGVVAKVYTRLGKGESAAITQYLRIPEEIRVDTKLFNELWDIHPTERGEVIIYGKKMKTPRWQQSYGRDYYYSGMLHKALPINKHWFLECILEWVKDHSGKPYEQILINWYENGNDYIGAHSDDEKQLVQNSDIYSFSFGQKRDFVVKAKAKDDPFKKTMELFDNSLIIMHGDMQKHYHHLVPKRAISKCLGHRINITFRLFKIDKIDKVE